MYLSEFMELCEKYCKSSDYLEVVHDSDMHRYSDKHLLSIFTEDGTWCFAYNFGENNGLKIMQRCKTVSACIYLMLLDFGDEFLNTTYFPEYLMLTIGENPIGCVMKHGNVYKVWLCDNITFEVAAGYVHEARDMAIASIYKIDPYRKAVRDYYVDHY